MAKICILIALLPQLLCTLGQVSPCPEYFTYMQKADEMIGYIEIKSPPKVREHHLRVALQIAAELPSNYVGKLVLARSREDSAQDIVQGRNLMYHVHFPLQQPIPTLSGIWFNNKKYCTGPETTPSTTVLTTITLDHTLYLPNMPVYDPQPNGLDEPIRLTTKRQPSTTSTTKKPTTATFSHGNVFLSQSQPAYSTNIFLKQPSVEAGKPPSQVMKPQPSQPVKPLRPQYTYDNIFLRPTTSATPIPLYIDDNYNIFMTPISPTKPPAPSSIPQHNIDNNKECGVSSRTGGTNLLIANGQKTLPGEWPWLAALFVVRKIYEFQCGASILTNRHVLTAAHCLKVSFINNETIHPNVLEVALGRFNLHRFREEGTENRQVTSYKIHPDYTHETTGDSDLAILILRTPVEYNAFIKPICLWSGSIELQDVVSRMGYVVGWGKDEYGNRYTEQPRMAMMPIVSLENCHWSNPSFVNLTSNRTFCAGSRDGSGPCNGDSGSGLVIYDSITSRYQLRGIVSRSLLGNEPSCDLSKFIVFVDVAKYLPWIRHQISTT